MSRKLALALMLAVVAAAGSVATTGSAHAGALSRIRGAIHANIEGDRRALHDVVCGQGARAAARDVIGGAELGVTFLRGGGGGFAKQKPC